MGSILRASCECGFEQGGIGLGGGMMNFTTYFGAPALCRHCRKLVVRNYLAKTARCPQCRRKVTYYNNPSVQAGPSGEEVASWNAGDKTFQLSATKYLCPQCGQKTMVFEDVGCCD
jgi:DNA-directed RNA polymerase subunit RPC12/RpoP